MVKKKKESKFKKKVSSNSRKQQSQSEGKKFGHLNLPKGLPIFKDDLKKKIQIDIMPWEVKDPKHLDRDDENDIAIPGDLWYKKPYRAHRNVGIDNDTEVCPTTFGKPCPQCEFRIKKIKEDGDEDEIRSLRWSLRNLYIIIPRKHKDYEEIPHLWDISQFCFQDLLNEDIDEDEDRARFPDLEDGLTLDIRFTQEKLGKNTFAKASRIEYLERKKPIDESILDDLPSLDDVISCLSYKAYEAKFFELDEDEEKEDTKSKRKVKDEEPEEEEEIEEDEEPEEEEEIEEDEEDGLDDLSLKELKKLAKKEGIKITKKDDEETLIEKIRDVREENNDNESNDKCPHGHKFGVDTDDHKECDDCDSWSDCIDVKEPDNE